MVLDEHRIVFGNKLENQSFFTNTMYLSQFSNPFKKSELIGNSYFVGPKFPYLFADALSECQVTALFAIL